MKKKDVKKLKYDLAVSALLIPFCAIIFGLLLFSYLIAKKQCFSNPEVIAFKMNMGILFFLVPSLFFTIDFGILAGKIRKKILDKENTNKPHVKPKEKYRKNILRLHVIYFILHFAAVILAFWICPASRTELRTEGIYKKSFLYTKKLCSTDDIFSYNIFVKISHSGKYGSHKNYNLVLQHSFKNKIMSFDTYKNPIIREEYYVAVSKNPRCQIDEKNIKKYYSQLSRQNKNIVDKIKN